MVVHGKPVRCIYKNLAHEIVKSGVTLEALAKNAGTITERLERKLGGLEPWNFREKESIVAQLELGAMNQQELWHKDR